MRTLMVSLFLGAACACAFAQDQKEETKPDDRDRRQQWAIDLGAYFPTDEEIRDRFSSALWRIGIRPYRSYLAEKGRTVFDATVIVGQSRGSRMLVVPLTVGFLKSFGQEGGRLTFVMAGVGPAYYNYSIERLVGSTIVDVRGNHFGVGGHVDVGVMIGDRLTLTGRYDWLSPSNDFDFSGFSLNLSWAAFRW